MVADPFARLAVGSVIAALPKADLHLHQETRARQERITPSGPHAV